MDKGSTAALNSAVGALKLKDIVLHAARFSRPTELDQEVSAHESVKRAVAFNRVPGSAGVPESLRIFVGLGVRIVGTSGRPPPVYLEIEADFVADYEIKTAITEDAIRAFASFNAVHNVWPFWRQHVFDVVNRGRLQHIDVPLYSGMPLGGVATAASPSKKLASTRRASKLRRKAR
jgi:hypothetical protein